MPTLTDKLADTLLAVLNDGGPAATGAAYQLLDEYNIAKHGDAPPPPAPIAGTVTSRADGEANFYTLLRQPHNGGNLRWLGRIQWNGELLVERQEQMTAQIVHALNAHRAHPIADKLAAIAQGDTYDEAALRQARDLLVSIRRRADHEVAEIDQLMSGGSGDVGDAAVLLAAVEPLYAKREG